MKRFKIDGLCFLLYLRPNMNSDTPAPYRPFALWLRWTIGNAASWLVGMSLAWVLGRLTESFSSAVLIIISWLVAGFFVGSGFAMNNLFSLRAVPGYFNQRMRGQWFITTILAWGISLAIVSGAGLAAGYGFTLAGFVIGLLLGGLQWLVIRRVFKFAWAWIPGQMLAWGMGAAMMDMLTQAIGFVLVGVISGAFSGGLLAWLFYQNRIPGDSESA